MREKKIESMKERGNFYRGTSKLEKEFISFIKQNYGGNIEINNTQLLSGQEIDVYLPDLKVAFEFNGTYYHSDLFKVKLYHLKKTRECDALGVTLYHIWDSEWIHKKEIVKSIVLNKINKTPNNFYARKCVIKEVNRKESTIFLNENHLQGNCISKVNLGLYYNEELVSLMTFGSLRKNLKQTPVDDHWELLRFCNKINTNVVGGASRLLKHFIKNYNPKKIFSYANRDISRGKLYEQMGFKALGYTPPGYDWFSNSKRFNRFNFRKDVLVKEGYDPSKTEYDIMVERGYYRVWNTGNIRYELEI